MGDVKNDKKQCIVRQHNPYAKQILNHVMEKGKYYLVLNSIDI